MCVPTPAKDINSTPCVHKASLLLDVQCQFPWGLLHFNLFIPTTTTETRSKKSKCKRINVNGKHALHMALFHKLLHNHTHECTVGKSGTTDDDGVLKLYILCDKTWKLLKGKRKLWMGLDASILYKILPFYLKLSRLIFYFVLYNQTFTQSKSSVILRIYVYNMLLIS